MAKRSLKDRWRAGEVRVTQWFERDRAHVSIEDQRTGKTIVDWWDDDVAGAFEDGFFVRGRGFEESVIDYAEHLGVGAAKHSVRANAGPVGQTQGPYWLQGGHRASPFKYVGGPYRNLTAAKEAAIEDGGRQHTSPWKRHGGGEYSGGPANAYYITATPPPPGQEPSPSRGQRPNLSEGPQGLPDRVVAFLLRERVEDSVPLADAVYQPGLPLLDHFPLDFYYKATRAQTIDVVRPQQVVPVPLPENLARMRQDIRRVLMLDPSKWELAVDDDGRLKDAAWNLTAMILLGAPIVGDAVLVWRPDPKFGAAGSRPNQGERERAKAAGRAARARVRARA